MNSHPAPETAPPNSSGSTRRKFLVTMGATMAGAVGTYRLYRRHYEAGWKAEVFVGRATDYDARLAGLIVDGLREIGVGRTRIRGRRILLKPNLVEPHRGHGYINTHPMMVRAAIEAFRKLGAKSVLVAEGPGHRRDSLWILDETGLGEMLRGDRVRFVDLNEDSLYRVANTGGRTQLHTLTLPLVLRKVDWVVSMPKLKTHHWVGVTLSMKNLFGLMPGIVYGWPKNVLHQAGINGCIFDINATVRPQLAIVDGIVGMEGDGPIMGTPRRANVVVIGRNFPAVDATCARIMGVDPAKIHYLAAAAGFLGPIREAHITQRGEPVAAVRTDFRLLDRIDAQRGIRLARS